MTSRQRNNQELLDITSDQSDGPCLSKKDKVEKDADRVSVLSVGSHIQTQPVNGEWNVTGGDVLIINNNKFTPLSSLNDRDGTTNDAKKLTTIFKSFGFTVNEVLDKKRDDILQEIETFTQTAGRMVNEGRSQCVFVVVMTHGTAEGWLYDKQGVRYSVKDICEPVVKCPELLNTPKIFIFQACRGDCLDKGINTLQASSQPQQDDLSKPGEVEDEKDHKEVMLDNCTKVYLPNSQNVLLVYSTVEDKVSWREREAKGSFFVTSLHEVLQSDPSPRKELIDILTKTNKILSKKMIKDEYQQTATFTSYLCYKLFLNKKLP